MPAFGNVLLPDMTADQMRGVWALLELISTPKSQEAQAFMTELVKVKDETLAAAAKAKEDRDVADGINKDLVAREAIVAKTKQEADKLMAEAKTLKATLDAKHAEYMKIFGGKI